MIPRKIDDEQGALTVFLDLRQDVSEERQESVSLVPKQEWDGELDYWEELFSELFIPQEIYYSRDYSVQEFPDANELNTCLKSALTEHRVKLPRGGRECLVFCYYLRLRDLTQSFADKLDDLIHSFSNLYSLDDSLQHIHLLCVEYQRSEMLPDLEQKLFLLSRLASNEYLSSFTTLLLYSALMRSTLGDQKKGLVNFLYLLSRKEAKYKLPLQNKRETLKLISYQDYYQDLVMACRRGIEEITEWLKQDTDPGFSALRSCLQPKLSEITDRFLRSMRGFHQRAGRRPVHPVRITQFEKTHMFLHEIRNIEESPVFKQTKERFVQELLDGLLEEFQPSGIEELNSLIENYHYPDLISLEEMLKGESAEQDPLEELLGGMIQDRQYQAEIGRLRSGVSEKLRTYLLKLPQVTQADQIRKRKLRRRSALEEQESKAGEYSSIRDCFDRIVDNTSFELGMVRGYMVPFSFVQVSEHVTTLWAMNDYEIRGVSEVSCVPEIEPYEVAVLKIASTYNLRDKEEIENLASSMAR